MKVDNVVNKNNKKLGLIKFDDDLKDKNESDVFREVDLVKESMDRLIQRQDNSEDTKKGDRIEAEKLKKYRESKKRMLLSNSLASSRDRESLEQTSVTIKEVHDMVNALNNSIAEIEKSYDNINNLNPQEKMKYEKLKEILNDAQNQK
jgi:hypothetical protein